MKILNLTGPSRSIGHTYLNKAVYLTDEQVVVLLDEAKQGGYTGIRFDWAWDSMFPSPKDRLLDRLLFIVRECAKRGLFVWAVHGSGPYPNQPGWVATAQGANLVKPTWAGSLPPLALHPYIIERIQIAVNAVWWLLTNMGFDPREVFGLQSGNEDADGGVCDPTRGMLANKDGTGLLLEEMAIWLETLALGINMRGMKLISPGMECQASSMVAEIKDLCSRPWMRRFDVIDVHCYPDLAALKGESVPDQVVRKWKKILDQLGKFNNVSGRPVWVGEVGSKSGVPRQVIDALLGRDCEAVAWFPL